MANHRPLSANSFPRLLIIEDELLVALIIEEMARNIGYRVCGMAHTVPAARQELARRNFDAVLLDVSFDAQGGFEFADLLFESKVPFAFVTGYDYLVEPRHESVPILQKPFTLGQLGALLVNLVGPIASKRRIALTA